MRKKFLAFSGLVLGLATLAGCDGKVENPNITHYSTDLCSLDAVGGKPDTSIYVKREQVAFVGWAIDASTKTAPKAIRLRLTGASGIPHTFENSAVIDRPDLVKAYNNQDILKSGFYIQADLSTLEPGGYGIIVEIPNGKTLLVCQPKKFLVVQ
ncbi:hypothetical protein N5D61_21800 [Pseudomonas sp. GD03842]|uniref:hypothetical protein n=1 Tax=unclassified Pseudomonas TaxID=196821 RepID=UPI000D3CD40B|nr:MULTISPECIES: hypothetical protein [unclassified Pseudomonas]MDH0748967.1 hypothetical protein [Pseudomonas sp. GD03842]RAU39463.1 hypothetical protein DBP26_026255 [Pseudomonas sp. RIT 409]RAU50700.1 hypothetical protein DBY65_021980 [Pseudomonas sp. RIT 412]